MNKTSSSRLVSFLVAIAALAVTVPVAFGETITFDEPGYVAGSLPPSPWLDEYDNITGWGVVTGGVDGSQCLMVDYPRNVAYDLQTPLTPSMGTQSISILFDPARAVSDYTANYLTYGGLQVGNGSHKYGTGYSLGVIFRKTGAGSYIIYGPGGGYGTPMGGFTPSDSQNYYEITFEINEDWDTMTVSAGPVGGTAVSMTAAWDGSDITRIWPVWGDSGFMGTGAFYDNLVISSPQPQTPGDANGDGTVNLDDFIILKQNYGNSTGVTFETGDFNGDGTVNLDDFIILKQNYGK